MNYLYIVMNYWYIVMNYMYSVMNKGSSSMVATVLCVLVRSVLVRELLDKLPSRRLLECAHDAS